LIVKARVEDMTIIHYISVDEVAKYVRAKGINRFRTKSEDIGCGEIHTISLKRLGFINLSKFAPVGRGGIRYEREGACEGT
jgi:hypothetical protein